MEEGKATVAGRALFYLRDLMAVCQIGFHRVKRNVSWKMRYLKDRRGGSGERGCKKKNKKHFCRAGRLARLRLSFRQLWRGTTVQGATDPLSQLLGAVCCHDACGCHFTSGAALCVATYGNKKTQHCRFFAVS